MAESKEVAPIPDVELREMLERVRKAKRAPYKVEWTADGPVLFSLTEPPGRNGIATLWTHGHVSGNIKYDEDQAAFLVWSIYDLPRVVQRLRHLEDLRQWEAKFQALSEAQAKTIAALEAESCALSKTIGELRAIIHESANASTNMAARLLLVSVARDRGWHDCMEGVPFEQNPYPPPTGIEDAAVAYHWWQRSWRNCQAVVEFEELGKRLAVAEAEVVRLRADLTQAQSVCDSLARRVAAQSELLSKRAESQRKE